MKKILHRLFNRFRVKPGMTKRLLITYLIAFTAVSGVGLLFLFNPWNATSQAAWFNDNWGYRKILTFTHNDDVGTPTKVKFDIDTTEAPDKFQEDCGDVRFTTPNGDILPYYYDSAGGACDTNSTDFYVLIPSIINGSNYIVMYYGNPTVVNGTESANFSESTTTPSGGAATAGSEEKAPSPAVYWAFDEGQGQTVNDATTNNVDGTFGANSSVSTDDPSWLTEDQCIRGKCLNFDGSADYVSIPDSNALDLRTNFTISSWVYTYEIADDCGAAVDAIFNKGRDSTSTYAYNLDIITCADDRGKFAIELYDGSNNPSSRSTTVATPNRWYHLVATYDGSNLNLYVDGKLEDTTATSVDPGNQSSPAAIGKNANGDNRLFRGKIDELKIYHFAKTADQVRAEYLGAAAVLGQNTQNLDGALSDGLVGYWKMDESADNSCSGGQDACDSSGNGNHGTDSGGSTVAATGKYGTSRDFDGTNDYIDAGSSSGLDNLPSSTGLTVSAWVKPDTTLSSKPFISKESGSSDGWSFRFAGGSLAFMVNSSGTAAQVTQSYSDTTNWHHVVATYVDTGDRKPIMYVDGVQVGTQTAATGTLTDESSRSLFLGRRGTGSEYYDGKVDEARVYNRALSAAEIKQLYNWAPGPLSYWKMDEGSGSTITDSSGNSNNSSNFTGDVSFTNGKYNKGLSFDGTNDVVRIPETTATDLGKTTDSFTLAAWVKTSVNAGSTQMVLVKDTGCCDYIELSINSSEFPLIGMSDNNGNFPEAVSTISTINDGKWHYIVGVRDVAADRLSIYVDGILGGSTTDTTTGDALNNSDWSIGNGGSSYTQFDYTGQIDDVKIYNYARTQAQIIEDMNAGHPAPGSPIGTPVGHWNFDQGFGTTANNKGSGGSALNGTLTSMASPATSTSGWTNSGKIGKGLSFDGTNDYVNMGTSSTFAVNGPFTVSAWVNPAAFSGNGNGNAIIGRYDDASSRRNYLLHTDNNGQLLFQTSTSASCASGGTVTLSSGKNLSTGVWQHVAGVYDGTHMHTYVNGVEVGTPAAQSSICTQETTFAVGARFGGGSVATSSSFNGKIDEPKFYAQALTAEQIKLDMNQGAGQVVGSLSSTQTQPNAASAIYCVPGDASSCDGPVGEWNFDEGSGTSAQDSSGNSNTGTLTSGPTYVNGKYNKGAQFDGTDDTIEVADASSLDVSSAITLSAWIKMNALDTGGDNELLQKSGAYGMKINSTGKFLGYRWGGSETHASTTTITAGRWYFVTWTFDGTTHRTYINGALEASSSNAGSIPTSSNGLQIGGPGVYFNGIMDQVRVYGYARSAAQVAWDYNRGEPFAHWEFDECQGSTIHDSSGNNLTGTWSGSTVGTCTTASTAWGDGASGKRNSSLYFDGSDVVNFGNPTLLEPTGALSVSVWVKPSTASLGSGFYDIIHNYDGGGTTGQYELAFVDGHIEFGYGASSSYVYWSPNNFPTLSAGTWYHIVFTHEGSNSTGYFYVNGTKYTTTRTGGPTDIPNCCNGDTVVGSPNFVGQIDDLRMYNYTLNDTQAKSLYNDNATYRVGPTTGAP